MKFEKESKRNGGKETLMTDGSNSKGDEMR